MASIVWWLLRERPLDANVHTHELVVGGSRRTYRVVVPHDCTSPTPIVFAFHGIGDSPDSMAAYCRLDRLAADNGFLLVYPAAQNSMWSTVNVDPSNFDANPDVQLFDALYSRLVLEHDIDFDRVYLTGMSNGASFIHVLATARTERIAALIAHSGLRPRELGHCDDSIPMLLLAGADDSVAAMMESNAELYRTAGCEVQFIRVRGLAHEWSTRHNAEMWRFLSAHSRNSAEEAEP